MPSGVPVYLRCRAPDPEHRMRCNGPNLVRVVGRKRVVGRGSARSVGMLEHAHMYTCLDCGHEGWSAHPDVLRLPTEQRDFTIDDEDKR